MCKKQIPLTTDKSTYFQSSARSRNPSLQLTSNDSFSPKASSPINLDSDLVTLPWTCCFYSPNNGWRSPISVMRSGLSLWTYLKLLIQSRVLPCSPNCLLAESKTNSTLGLLTSSTLLANVSLSIEPFNLLCLSRLQYPMQCSRSHIISSLHQWSH